MNFRILMKIENPIVLKSFIKSVNGLQKGKVRTFQNFVSTASEDLLEVWKKIN